MVQNKSAVYEAGCADKHGNVKKRVKLIHFSKLPKLKSLKTEIRNLEKHMKRKKAVAEKISVTHHHQTHMVVHPNAQSCISN